MERIKGDITRITEVSIQNPNFDDPRMFPEISKSLFDSNIFLEGIKEYCIKRGYTKDIDNLFDLKDFIADCAVDAHIYADKSEKNRFETNLRNWLGLSKITPTIPDNNNLSRENVYKLCFSLKMNLEEVEDFFYFRYRCRPFNLHVLKEVVYYYCFKTEKGYSYSAYLLNELKKRGISDSYGGNFECVSTASFFCYLKQIKSEDQFFEFCNENRSFFLPRKSQTALNCLEELKKLCRKQCLADKNVNNSFWDELLGSDFKKRETNIPKALSKALADKESISRITSDNKPNGTSKAEIKKFDNLGRNTIILLSFYQFFKALENKQIKNKKESNIMTGKSDNNEYVTPDVKIRRQLYDEFVTETNNYLELCGLSQLYARDPVDFLFMKSAFQSRAIRYFREAVRSFEQ